MKKLIRNARTFKNNEIKRQINRANMSVDTMTNTFFISL